MLYEDSSSARLVEARRPLARRTPQLRLACGFGALLAAVAISVGAAFATSAAAAVPGVLYDGTAQLNAGQIPFPYQSMVPGHVTVVKDPLGANFNVMRLAIADSDRPYSGASNPRADMETSAYYSNGSDLYTSIKFLEPAAFPVLNSGFFQIAEVYGPPHGGSPPVGIDLFPGAGGRPVVSLQRGAAFGYDRPWTASSSLDTNWHTIYLHTHMAPDNTGFVELWYDGAQQRMTNGTTRVNYPTLASGVNWDGHTANVLHVNQYRLAGAYPGTIVTYQAAAKIGTTLASVQDTTTTTTTAPPPPPPPAPTTTPTRSPAHPTSPPSPLAARFRAPASSTTGHVVRFNASPSTGSPVKYVWTDRKHTLGTGRLLRRRFRHAGIKHITLTVTDASGRVASVEHQLRVRRRAHSRHVSTPRRRGSPPRHRR
jgi:cell division septation protein DedD